MMSPLVKGSEVKCSCCSRHSRNRLQPPRDLHAKLLLARRRKVHGFG